MDLRHPILDIQARNQSGSYERHYTDMVDDNSGVLDSVGIDSTPLGVAAFGLGALAVLWGLKYAGFRFAFGVSAGR